MAQRILLVDDEFDMLDMLGEVFRENGYAVETAENGIEALRVLARGSFDLLLSDINMPQMKGFELRARKEIGHMLAIFAALGM